MRIRPFQKQGLAMAGPAELGATALWLHMLPAKTSKGFSLQPRIVSTREAVGSTHQAKLNLHVGEKVWSYIPFPRSQMLQ